MKTQLLIHLFETTKHKLWVLWYIIKACMTLLRRGLLHDLSKYSRVEAFGFASVLPRLKDATYGSDEYKQLLDELEPVLSHHYHSNRHHPEHFGGTLSGMTAIDIIEMVCDWKAATKRHVDGNMMKSLGINNKRFGMSSMELYELHVLVNEVGLL